MTAQLRVDRRMDTPVLEFARRPALGHWTVAELEVPQRGHSGELEVPQRGHSG